MSNIQIPYFYSLWFTTIDPLVAVHGAYMNIFTPATTLDAYIPAEVAPYNPNHYILFQIEAAHFLCLAFLSTILLRYTQDIQVWKIMQAAILIVDLGMLYSLGNSLDQQGRLAVAKWRAEDWGCLLIVGFVTLLRSAFLLEVRFRAIGGTTKRD